MLCALLTHRSSGLQGTRCGSGPSLATLNCWLSAKSLMATGRPCTLQHEPVAHGCTPHVHSLTAPSLPTAAAACRATAAALGSNAVPEVIVHHLFTCTLDADGRAAQCSLELQHTGLCLTSAACSAQPLQWRSTERTCTDHSSHATSKTWCVAAVCSTIQLHICAPAQHWKAPLLPRMHQWPQQANSGLALQGW